MALYPVRVAADQLGVAYSTLKRWVHTGHVRTTRTEGGHHRISDNEIARLTGAATAGGAPAPAYRGCRRVAGRAECAESPARIHRGGPYRRPPRSSPHACRRSVVDGRDHGRCRAGAQTASRR